MSALLKKCLKVQEIAAFFPLTKLISEENVATQF